MNRVIDLEDLENNIIYVKKSDIIDDPAQSKIIKIALLTPRLGKGIDKSSEVEPLGLIWATKSTFEKMDKKSFQLVYEDKYLNPWILVKRIKEESYSSDKIN